MIFYGKSRKLGLVKKAAFGLEWRTIQVQLDVHIPNLLGMHPRDRPFILRDFRTCISDPGFRSLMPRINQIMSHYGAVRVQQWFALRGWK